MNLPAANDAERNLLGAVLIDGALMSRVTGIVKAEDFAAEAHVVIFMVMVTLGDRREPIDLITVQAELDRGGQLERAGGPAYLSSLVDVVPDVENVAAYARLVREASLRRLVIFQSQRTIRDAASAPIGQVIENARHDLDSLTIPVITGTDTGQIVTALEFVNKVWPAPPWLAPGLLAVGSINMLSSEPYVGKTALALWGSSLLAAGRPALGSAPARPVKILYWAGEGSPVLLSRRLGGMLASVGVEPEGLPFSVLAGDAEQFDSIGFERTVAASGADLVVCDTLSRFFRGDENSARDWKTMAANPLLRIARAHAVSFLILHHYGKANDTRQNWDRARGTSSMFGDTDGFWRLEKPVGGEPDERTLIFDKIKDSAERPPVRLTFDKVAGVFTEAVTMTTDKVSPEAKLRAEAEKIFRLVLVNPGLTHEEIGSALQTRKADRLAAHKLLVASGRIFGQQKGDGKTFGWHVSTTPRQRLALEVPEGSHEVPENAGTSPVEDEVPKVPPLYERGGPGTSSTPEELHQISSAGSGNPEPHPERAVGTATVAPGAAAVSQPEDEAPPAPEDAPEPVPPEPPRDPLAALPKHMRDFMARPLIEFM